MKKIITTVLIIAITFSLGITAQLHINSQVQVKTWGGKHPGGMKDGDKIVNYEGKHPHYKKDNKGKPGKKNITNYKYKDGELIFNPSGNKKRLKREMNNKIKQKMREMAIQKLKSNGKWNNNWDIFISTGGE